MEDRWKFIDLEPLRLSLKKSFPPLESISITELSSSKLMVDIKLDSNMESLDTEMVYIWKDLYEMVYQQKSENASYNFDWLSSYNHQPFSNSDIEEWNTKTLKILSAIEAKKILEVGFGQGVLLQQLAPRAEKYVGVELSNTSVSEMKRFAENRSDLKHLELIVSDAKTCIDQLKNQEFDLIILYSVVQHFPSLQYLTNVIEGLSTCLNKNKGCIFIGDIRWLEMQHLYYISHQQYRNESLSTESFASLLHSEDQLIISGKYFLSLKEAIPKLSHINIQPKILRVSHELTKFRGDVMLYFGNYEKYTAPFIDWREEEMNLEQLKCFLKINLGSCLGISHLPNAYLKQEIEGYQQLCPEASKITVEETITPYRIEQLAIELDVQIEFSYNRCDPMGSFDVVFYQTKEFSKNSLFEMPKTELTNIQSNHPCNSFFKTHYIKQIKRYLHKNFAEFSFEEISVNFLHEKTNC